MKFVEYKSLDDDHPIFDACKYGNLEVVQSYFERGGTAYVSSERRSSAIGTAIRAGQLEVLRIMRRYDLDVNRPLNRFGETPLIYAIRAENLEVVAFFISEGANVNQADEHGFTPICCASGTGNIDVFKAILAAGGRLEEDKFRGVTPLMNAASCGKLEMMDFLLSIGANTGARDERDATSLIRAAKAGNIEVCKWLIHRGVDLGAKDNRRKTALDWAEVNGHQDIVNLLKSSTEQ